MGGPIKQGVMHGIREPYAGGGKAALVGNPVYPKTGGREHHFAVSGTIAGVTALNAARIAATRAAVRYGPKAIKWAKNFFGRTAPGKTKNIYTGYSEYGPATYRTVTTPGTFTPNWLGRDPLVQGANWARKAIFNPTAAGWGKKAVRFATSPSSLAVGGLYYANGRWFNKKNEEVPPPVDTGGVKKGDKDYGPHTKGPPTITASARDAKAKADKEKRINDLLDTMGYDKARKNAAYDALIDAGRMISERGTLDPKNIGRELIDPIVASTSQRFDKPEQIREAVGLMQTKADIQKEMNKEETALANRVKEMQLLTGQKALAGATLEETTDAYFTRHGSWPSGDSLANLARNKGINITEVVDTSTKATGLKEIGDPVAFMEGKVKELKEAGTEIPPGLYVVEDSIIIIDAEGNVSRR